MKSTLLAILIAIVIALVWILWGGQAAADADAPLGSVRVAIVTSSVAQMYAQAQSQTATTRKGGAIM